MVHHRELIFGDPEGDRARAHWWSDDLVSGRSVSMDEIGKHEGVGKRYVSRMICLAFLAPTIIQSIAEDRRNLPLSFLSTGCGDPSVKFWQLL